MFNLITFIACYRLSQKSKTEKGTVMFVLFRIKNIQGIINSIFTFFKAKALEIYRKAEKDI